jgi:alcohol dehydrogenase, propanol-preferring
MCMAEGGETRCLEMMNSGRKINGTFAEYTLVPYRYLMALPETLSDETIAPILCGGVTIYKALKICGATAGQWVVISGAGGGVGALGIQYAVAMGYRVVAIDGGQEKALYCEQMGAEVYINFMEEKDVPSRVILATDGCGANAALMVAGSGQAYQQAFQMMAPFGTIVCIGIPPPTDLVHFHPLTFIDKGIKLFGSAVGTRKDVLEALEFVKRGKVTPVVQTAQLEELNDIAAEFSTGKASVPSLRKL